MGFQPITVDDSFVPSANRINPRVPEGPYLGKLAGIEISPEDHSGEPYFRWKFALAKGPGGLGQILGHFGTWKKGAQFGNATVLSGYGIPPTALNGQVWDTYAKFKSIAEQLAAKLAGRDIGLMVADDIYQGTNGQTATSKIVDFFSAAEYDSRATFVAQQPVAPAAPLFNQALPGAPAAPAAVDTASLGSALDDLLN